MTKKQRALDIIRTLRDIGFEAYWVGGCVRDILRHVEPKDYDIVTSATPDKIKTLFINFHEVGEKFGVLMLDFIEGNFEVATYRQEFGYSDKRRPDQVRWSSAKEDVLRRDFTINGLLYDPVNKKVIDYVDGQRDLNLSLIRFIGKPADRVREDPLRMLRAVRFKNSLGFQYDKATFEAIETHASEITFVSAERIGHELNLMLGAPRRVDAIRDLDRLGLLKIILPEIDELKGTPQPFKFHQEGDVFDHILKALSTLTADAPAFLAWAVILHDIAKPLTLQYPLGDRGGRLITTYGHAQKSATMAREILSRLRFTRQEIETVSWLIEHHMSLKGIEEMRPARRENYVLDPRFPWLLELHHADAAGAIPINLSLYHQNLKLYQKMKAEHEKAKRSSTPLLLDGYDLQQALQLDPGPKIGELLEIIRDAQLYGEISTKEQAIEYARKYL